MMRAGRNLWKDVMNTVTKSVSMFLLSVLIMMLLVTIALGFMLGFSHPLPWILIGVLVIIPFIHDKIISRRFVQWNDDMSVELSWSIRITKSC